MFESEPRIKSIINAVGQKTGFKHLSVKSAVQTLCDGYVGSVGTYEPTASASESLCESINGVHSLVEKVNTKTGTNHPDLTHGVQTLCDGYVAETPLYSFGVLSDIHLQYLTGFDDFQRALTYLKDVVPFTCICGDLVSAVSDETMGAYKSYVDAYAGDMSIYECGGNHECYYFNSEGKVIGGEIDENGDIIDNSGNVMVTNPWVTYTGKTLYYSFTHENDVFIMLSLHTDRPYDLFPTGALDWLESLLEENKDKRCFVFMHTPDPNDKGAEPYGVYPNIMGGTSGQAFISLLKKYDNTVWFHGHTHITLGEIHYPISSVDELGYRSVHIPSLAQPRYYDSATNSLKALDGAEGYIVDVYANKIVLRGIDFACGINKDEVAQMANEMYALDTI